MNRTGQGGPEVLKQLLDIEHLNKDERDYLDVLGTLIREYQDEHYPIEDVSGIHPTQHMENMESDLPADGPEDRIDWT